MCWHILVILALGRWTKGSQEVKASLSYIVSLKPAWAT